MTNPMVGVGSGRGLSLSSVTLNCLMMFVKKRNISVCARAIPRHWRLPTRKGIKRSSLTKFPDSSRNRSGLSSLGFVQYSGSLRMYQRKAKTVVPAGRSKLSIFAAEMFLCGVPMKLMMVIQRTSLIKALVKGRLVRLSRVIVESLPTLYKLALLRHLSQQVKSLIRDLVTSNTILEQLTGENIQ